MKIVGGQYIGHRLLEAPQQENNNILGAICGILILGLFCFRGFSQFPHSLEIGDRLESAVGPIGR